jgi:primosomal protein N' (replication factor Y)
LVASGYETAADQLLAERSEAGFPPAARMALVRAEAPHAQPPFDCLEAARERLASVAAAGCDAFGPAPAPMERVAGRYRAQLALQAPDRRPLHRTLQALRPWLETASIARRVRWSLDVDPVDLM